MSKSQPEPQKFYHIVKDNKLIRGMVMLKSNATKIARQYPGSKIVVAAGRAELRSMGIEVER